MIKKSVLKTVIPVIISFLSLIVFIASPILAENTGADLMNSVMQHMKQQQGIDIENPSPTERDALVDRMIMNDPDIERPLNPVDFSMTDQTAILNNTLQSVIQEVSQKSSADAPPILFQPSLPDDLIVGAAELDVQRPHCDLESIRHGTLRDIADCLGRPIGDNHHGG